jgi:ribokinase
MSGTKITVLGSYVVDLMGRAPHLPAAGETVKGSYFKAGPGGKGSNQAVAAKRAGAEVSLITKVGRDHFGEMAVDNFRQEGIDTAFVFVDDQLATGAALIMVDQNSSENMILVTLGACSRITEEEIEEALGAIEQSRVLLTQLETNLDAVEWTVAHAARRGVPVILNPAPAQEIPARLMRQVHILTPNESEASLLTGIEVTGPEQAGQAAEALRARGAKNVIVTLGKMGCLVAAAREQWLVKSMAVEAVDTTGAGDAFNGALATALAEGKSLFEAARFANTAGALAVTRMGTAPAMPHRAEILLALNDYGEDKIVKI